MWELDYKESQRIDAFELWCWRKLLRVPCTARRSNQSILKESSPEFLLEGLMLKLKLQNFVHLMLRADSLENTQCWERFKVGGEGDDRGWDGWMASLTQWTEFEWVLGIGDGQGRLECFSPWGGIELDTTEWLNWTELHPAPDRIGSYSYWNKLSEPNHFK